MLRAIPILTWTLGLVLAGAAWSQQAAAATAAELLEQARAKSRDYEELKAVLNGPDANMRLATFEVMAASDDPAIREVAIDVALAGTDAVLQALALKTLVLSQRAMVFNLEVDTSQPEAVQERARAILASDGNLYTRNITDTDPASGMFIMKQYKGQVSGTQISFTHSYDKGTLTLVDEATLRGPITVYKGGYGGFIATWTLR
jgi:hypothetical protein